MLNRINVWIDLAHITNMQAPEAKAVSQLSPVPAAIVPEKVFIFHNILGIFTFLHNMEFRYLYTIFIL